LLGDDDIKRPNYLKYLITRIIDFSEPIFRLRATQTHTALPIIISITGIATIKDIATGVEPDGDSNISFDISVINAVYAINHMRICTNKKEDFKITLLLKFNSSPKSSNSGCFTKVKQDK